MKKQEEEEKKLSCWIRPVLLWPVRLIISKPFVMRNMNNRFLPRLTAMEVLLLPLRLGNCTVDHFTRTVLFFEKKISIDVIQKLAHPKDKNDTSHTQSTRTE